MRRLRIVVGNVSADFTEVCNRRIGPDYFEVHAVAQESTSCSTFSWLLARPATISARPCRIDAMMCNSSVISSRDALSGSLSRASITACLSVMAKNEARVSLKGKMGMRFCLIFAACLTCVPRTRSSLALASHNRISHSCRESLPILRLHTTKLIRNPLRHLPRLRLAYLWRGHRPSAGCRASLLPPILPKLNLQMAQQNPPQPER